MLLRSHRHGRTIAAHHPVVASSGLISDVALVIYGPLGEGRHAVLSESTESGQSQRIAPELVAGLAEQSISHHALNCAAITNPRRSPNGVSSRPHTGLNGWSTSASELDAPRLRFNRNNHLSNWTAYEEIRSPASADSQVYPNGVLQGSPETKCKTTLNLGPSCNLRQKDAEQERPRCFGRRATAEIGEIHIR